MVLKQKDINFGSKIKHWVMQNFLRVPLRFFDPLNTSKQTKTKPEFVSLLLKF